MNVMGPENASKTSDFFMVSPAARPPAMCKVMPAVSPCCVQPRANYAARDTATVKSELFAGL